MMAKPSSGTSLEVQGLRLHVSTTGSAEGTGSLSGTKIPHAIQLGPKAPPKQPLKAKKQNRTPPPPNKQQNRALGKHRSEPKCSFFQVLCEM